jgi:hypothetical protein
LNFVKDIDESNGDDDDEVVLTAEKSDKLYSPVEKFVVVLRRVRRIMLVIPLMV